MKNGVPEKSDIEKIRKVTDYARKGLRAEQIAKLVDVPLPAIHQYIKSFERQNKERANREETEAKTWLFDEKEEWELIELAGKELSIKQIAKLMSKKEKAVTDMLRDIRNDLVHNDREGKGRDLLTSAQHNAILKLGSDEQWGKTAPKTEAKATRIRQADNIPPAGKYVLHEWWQFGVLKKITNSAYQTLFTSADGNTLKLIKRYTPNFKEILLKAQGLRGKFVSMQVVQNYENTEPRVIDITASQGIMALAKPFPGDTRPVSFSGRYQWHRFGKYDFQTTNRHFIISNEEKIMVYLIGSQPENLENRLHNALDVYEGIGGKAILVCTDMKGGTIQINDEEFETFVDVHPEEFGLDMYNEDYNTIVETIAYTQDEAAKSALTLEEQHKMLDAERFKLEEEFDKKQKQLEQERLRVFSETTNQQQKITNQLADLRNKLQRELNDYNAQERFLRESKEGLHDYAVKLLAEQRDKAGKATVVRMDGLKLVENEPIDVTIEGLPDSDLKDALVNLRKVTKKRIIDLRRSKRAEKDDLASLIEERDAVDEQIDSAIPEPDDVPEADVTLFDEQKPTDLMPDMLKQMLEQMKALQVQNDTIIQGNALKDVEAQRYSAALALEQTQLSGDKRKVDKEIEVILGKLDEIVGKTINVKVSGGHPRNCLLLRTGINLYLEKAQDRIDAQFTKHIGDNNFIVFLPKHNYKAVFSMVVCSDDQNDLCVKTCKTLEIDADTWIATEEEITGIAGKRIVAKPKKLKQWYVQIMEKLDLPIRFEVL